MASKFEIETELKSPANAFWNTMKDLNSLYPKIFPDVYESTEILEGDGKSAGTVYRITYVDGVGVGKSYKSKIESVDDENRTLKTRIIEGDILEYYKFLDVTIAVSPKGKGSVVFSSCTYEKHIAVAPDGGVMKNSWIGVYKKLDNYTLANI